jgi:hypothetical protein
VLKNSDFRLDHNCRDRAAVMRNFCYGLGLQQRSRPSDLRSRRTGSFKFKGAQTRSAAIFPREANSGVFQHREIALGLNDFAALLASVISFISL